MAETERTTFEIAKLCPICELPGDDRSKQPGRNSRGEKVVLHMIFCVNTECRWFDTSWVVQVNPDGSVPEPYSQLGDKKFLPLPKTAQDRFENLFERQLEAEVKSGGAEIINPNDPRR